MNDTDESYWLALTDEILADTTADFRHVVQRSSPIGEVNVWEWAPGDMTRYTIIESKMPCALDGVPHGAGVLISVLHPTQAAALFMGEQQGELFSEYVASNLGLDERDKRYTADALTVMIGTILRRQPVVRTEWWKDARWNFLTSPGRLKVRAERDPDVAAD